MEMEYLKVFILSAMPVVEIRGGFPLGIVLGLSRWEALLVSILGNIVIIIPLLILLARLEQLILKIKVINNFYLRMVKKARSKAQSFSKYGKYALLLFVAIPMPTTGAWTACVAAHLFGIPMKDAFSIISLGVVICGFLLLTAKLLAVSGYTFFW